MLSVRDPEERLSQLMQLHSRWYLKCSATGTYFPLSQLSYWNAKTQEVYCSPFVMPCYKGLSVYRGP